MFRKYYEELHKGIKSLHELINRLNKKEEITSVSLMRRILGSIDLSEEPNEEVFNNRAGAIFKDVIEPKLKKMAREQERFTTAESADWSQVMFGRGTLNGIELAREEFEKAYAVYQQANQPPEPFDERNPLPEI
jgi:hypothetical protein